MSWESTAFESLLEAVPDALVGVDEAGVIRFVNRRTESLFGYDRGDLSANRSRRWFPCPCVDGTEFPVDIALSHVENEDDMLVIAAVRDLDPSQRAEADRLRAERMLAIVEYSDDAIIDTTADGIITSWNPAAARIFGYSSAEVLGAPDDLLVRHHNGRETLTEVLFNASVYRDAEGHVLGAFAAAQPVRGAQGDGAVEREQEVVVETGLPARGDQEPAGGQRHPVILASVRDRQDEPRGRGRMGQNEQAEGGEDEGAGAHPSSQRQLTDGIPRLGLHHPSHGWRGLHQQRMRCSGGRPVQLVAAGGGAMTTMRPLYMPMLQL